MGLLSASSLQRSKGVAKKRKRSRWKATMLRKDVSDSCVSLCLFAANIHFSRKESQKSARSLERRGK